MPLRWKPPPKKLVQIGAVQSLIGSDGDVIVVSNEDRVRVKILKAEGAEAFIQCSRLISRLIREGKLNLGEIKDCPVVIGGILKM